MKSSIAIIITNINGGGTKRHVDEISNAWKEQGYRVLVIRVVERVIHLSILEKDISQKNIFIFKESNLKKLKNILKFYKTQLIHVHHLLDANAGFFKLHRELNVPLVVTLHDYYSICPFIKLTNVDEEYCGEKGKVACNECLEKRRFYSKTLDKFVKTIDEWRIFWYSYLQEAELVVVPSEDMRNRIYRYYPCLNLKVFENPEIIDYGKRFRQIGLIGDLSVAKGAKKIKECVSYIANNKLPFQFIVFGNIQDVQFTKEEKKYILILGAYEETKVYKLISSYDIDFFWFPGVWPETYSYTLSIPIRLRIPCISTNLGAIASRINYNGWGKTYPWQYEGEKIVEQLSAFSYGDYRKSNFTIKNCSFGNLANYYKGIDLKESDFGDNKNIIIDKLLSFPKFNEKISPAEFKYMWDLADKKQKIILFKYLDKVWILSILKQKGVSYLVKKVWERVFS